MPSAEENKLRGGYYTPAPIADFLAAWAVRRPDAQVIEPSCGDGNILAPAAALLKSGKAVGLELFPGEAAKARRRAGKRATVHSGDAFKWYWKNRALDSSFDAALGNPPFIRYQSLPEETRELAFRLLEDEGLKPSRLMNAWVLFIILSTRLLKPGGRLAMVIPAEIMQVSYSSGLREYLARKYSHIHVVTFKKLVFDGILQETVLLLGERSDAPSCRMAFVEFDDASDLSVKTVDAHPEVKNDLDHASEKWTRFFLSSKELGLLRELEKEEPYIHLGDLAAVNVGVVTGRNKFFVLSEIEATNLGVRQFCIPVIG